MTGLKILFKFIVYPFSFAYWILKSLENEETQNVVFGIVWLAILLGIWVYIGEVYIKGL